MIKISDFPVEKAQELFISLSIDVAFLVPTTTGLKKSIMDATKTLRILLKENKIHDYDMQKQGSEYKVTIDAEIIKENDFVNTKISLYRPRTKKGDPRIWVNGLKKYCTNGNLLAFFSDNGKIYVINLSDANVYNSILNKSFVYYFLQNKSLEINKSKYRTVNELLIKLKAIHDSGFHQSVVDGDSAVGMTLENLLGIKINSNKLPDYKGIEIKCNRSKIRAENRTVLFSQAPNWKKSKLKSGLEIVKRCGYLREGILRLYCTVNSKKPNAQGLLLEVDSESNTLSSKFDDNGRFDEVAIWELETLKNRLLEKHANTFWITAESRTINGKEEFLYKNVIYTQSPSVTAFIQLIEESIITLDFSLKEYKDATKDHGYLFKIKKSNLGLLFPPPKKFDLTSLSEKDLL